MTNDERMNRRRFVALTGTTVVGASAGCSAPGDESPAQDLTPTGTNEEESTATPSPTDAAATEVTVPEDASVSLELPTDGASVTSPVQVSMNAENVAVEPAGEVSEGAGHFHLLVDTGPVDTGEVIPSDDQHLHFGDGSEQAIVELTPGEHDLTLQLGDGNHRALPVTDEASIEVTGESSVAFEEPGDGATVASPVSAAASAEGLTVEPADEVAQNAGHFHVLVDTEPVEAGEVIPDDDRHLHFGDGSSEFELDLDAGEHDLVLQFGNGAHEAYPVTDEVTVTVE